MERNKKGAKIKTKQRMHYKFDISNAERKQIKLRVTSQVGQH